MPLFDENECLCTAAQAGDEQAREQLVLRNLGFCAVVARRYRTAAQHFFHSDCWGRSDVPLASNLDDLTQTAVVGLLEAIDHWEPEKGAFLTIAELFMRKAIRSLLGVRSLKRTVDNDPDGLGLARLDAPIGDDGEDTLSSLLPDPEAVSPERYAVQRDTVETVRRCLSLLSPEDVELLTLRHLHGLTDKEISERCGHGTSWTQYHLLNAEKRLRRMDEFSSLMDASLDPRRGGTQSFRTTHTSSVEAAVLNRERRKKP